MNLKKRDIFSKDGSKNKKSFKKLICDYFKFNIFNCNKQLILKTF